MTTSEAVNEIAAACAKAQAATKPATKSAENEGFKRNGKASKYADLASIVAATSEYAKNDVAIFQSVASTADGALVTTRLMHKSGQWIESDVLFVPLSKKDAHGMGSAITYGKRYQLQGMTLIAADEDDDGNAAAQPAAAPVDDGYFDWLTDLEAVAEGGTVRLLDTIKASPEQYRARLKTEPKRWTALKTRAEKHDKAAA